MYKFLFIIAFLFTLYIRNYASIEFTQKYKTALDNTLSFDFKKANTIIEREKITNPNNKIYNYIYTYQLFLQSVVTENEATSSHFIKMADQTLKELSYQDYNKYPYVNYCICDINLQKAFVYFKSDSYVSGVNALRKSLNALTLNEKTFSTFVPNTKVRGLINIALGSVPTQYNWLLNVFNIKASVNTGLAQIKSLAQTCLNNSDYFFLRQESFLLWQFTAGNYGNNTQAIKEIKNIFVTDSLQYLFRKSPLMTYSKMSIFSHLKENEEAIKCYFKLDKTNKDLYLHYLDFRVGECLLYNLDITSKYYFEKYLQVANLKSYKKSATQKLAWIELIKGSESKYKTLINSILVMPKTVVDADKQALNEAKKQITPNLFLLKARLLFDGAYYSRAKDMISSKEAISQYNTKVEILEYYYRLGRIFHEWGQSAQAQKYYGLAIEKGKEERYYFAANAALQSGLLHEQQKNYNLAKEMYLLCLSMNYDEFQNSISQKAKAGLNRIQNK
jgi:hypothetical protein